MKILFFGDIVGKTGRQAVAKVLPGLREKYSPNLVIANVENLAHGKGVTLSTFEYMLNAGVDFFTSGNHVFDKPQAREVFEKYGEKLIRPANWESNFPGLGSKIVDVPSSGAKVLVINLLGQVFMEKQIDEGKIGNPFLKLNEILETPEVQSLKIRLLDFHAEATSEKRGMGFWADGKLSAVLGTHTHVPTADAQILPGGTGYQTDLGMTGAADSIIGVTKDSALKRFLAGEQSLEKVSLEVAETENFEVGFCVLEIDEASGKCQNINSQVIYS